jgi:hypothetical protein
VTALDRIDRMIGMIAPILRILFILSKIVSPPMEEPA